MSVLQYQVRQKSNPLKLFAVFSAIALNFSVKFYVFMCVSCQAAFNKLCRRLQQYALVP